MTRKNGFIGGVIIGFIVYGFFKWVQSGGSFTTEQLAVVNTIFMITTLIFIVGFFLGVVTMIRQKDVLDSTTTTGALIGFTSVFNAVTLIIAFVQGQNILSI